MNDLQKQILIGGLIGILLCVATYIALGGKREELDVLSNAIVALQKEVDEGKQYKANYAVIKKEVDEQNKHLDALVALMPSELERGELPIKLKKLADTAGMDQVQFDALNGSPKPEQYHTAYPIAFTFRSGFHDFGRFASLISGFEKMVNISAVTMKRSGGGIFPIAVSCTVTAFVYNPSSVPTKAAPRPASAAPKSKDE